MWPLFGPQHTEEQPREPVDIVLASVDVVHCIVKR